MLDLRKSYAEITVGFSGVILVLKTLTALVFSGCQLTSLVSFLAGIITRGFGYYSALTCQRF